MSKELIEKAKQEISKELEEKVISYTKELLRGINSCEKSIKDFKESLKKIEDGDYSEIPQSRR